MTSVKSARQKGKVLRSCLCCHIAISEKNRKYCSGLECQKNRKTKGRKTFIEKNGKEYIRDKMKTWRWSTGRSVKSGGSIAEDTVFQKLTDRLPELRVIRRTRSIVKNPRTGSGLELDLYLPEINVAIEVDGSTHRTNCYGEERLSYQLKNDKIKNKECKKKRITLARVPFGRDIGFMGEVVTLSLDDFLKLLKDYEAKECHSKR